MVVLLTEALQFARQGFSVVPVNSAEKRPHICWRKYQEQRATDGEMCRWWQRWPKAGVGFITGAISGLSVVDIDGAIGHETARKNRLLLPATPCVMTPRGGFHLYYRHPGRWVDNQTGIYPNIDVKGDGGFVLAPPTSRTEGTYEWVPGLALDDISLAELPDWVPVGGEKDFHRLNIKSMKAPASLGKALSQIAILLGMPSHAVYSLGSPFYCVLPGHTEDKPSASLYQMDDGTIMYRDWHKRDGREWYGLPEVYAAQHYGQMVILSQTEYKVWETRFFAELGLLILPPVRLLPLPASASRGYQKVYAGFELLLRCKWLVYPGSATAFTGPFAAAWCGTSHVTAKTAIKSFLQQGLMQLSAPLIRMGRHELWTFLPGDGMPRSGK